VKGITGRRHIPGVKAFAVQACGRSLGGRAEGMARPKGIVREAVMNSKRTLTQSTYLWLFLLIASAVLLQSFQNSGSNDSQLAATYSQGSLHVVIPYSAEHAGAGHLTVEVLDPEDHAVGKTERPAVANDGKGTWRADIQLPNNLSLDDIAWQRLRYRFSYDDSKTAAKEGTSSISEILRRPSIHVVGQQSYLSGGTAAVRVIATDSRNELITSAASVKIELAPPGQPARTLFTGKLNQHGTTEAQFRLPPGLVGSFPLHYVIDTPIGSAEYTEPVRIEDKSSILLTTEKPIYQPGQTIHARALSLDRANHEATQDRSLTFELEDSKGNKVFKKATKTDRFGVASADFALADEVNLGTYHLRVAMAGGGERELAVNVERYVLPKFKVAVDFSGAGNKRHGYRPGEHVTGTVRANYFFGKAVDAAPITVHVSGMDVAMFEAGRSEGKTDQNGAYHFDIALPTYFAGHPLSQGTARLLVEATVKDAAGHSETRGEPIVVSQSPLIITAVPEGGTLAPNLENQVFILTSYADGQPAKTDLTVNAPGNPQQKVTTDEGGVAVVRMQPAAGKDALEIEAADREGNHAKSSVDLQTRTGADQVLLRADRAVYRAGDRMDFHVFSTRQRGTAYVDVVKDGQTVLTRDVDIVNGRADLTLTATAQLAGTLDCNAYLFGGDARAVADHRLIFVQPADELKVEAKADAAVYKPGDDARIRFRVTNSHGEGVQAALGVQVVDEAVFALAEKQPGFAKVFFYLEQEVMKPRYEIHSIGMPEVTEPVPAPAVARRDMAARALFAATEMVNNNRFETDFGRAVPRAKYQEYLNRYQTAFAANILHASADVTRAYVENHGDLTKGDGPAFRDAWGGKVSFAHWYQPNVYMVRSAGPDQRFNTADDLATYVELSARKIVGMPTNGPSAIHVNLQHDRGPYNGKAAIIGTVVDQRGGAMEGAVVTLHAEGVMNPAAATVNADGEFTFSAVPPGTYNAEVRMENERVYKQLTFAARDHAVLAVVLRSAQEGAVLKAANGAVFTRMALLKDGEVFDQKREERFMVMAGAQAMPAPPPMAAAMGAAGGGGRGGGGGGARRADDKAKELDGGLANKKMEGGADAPHVRSYFPEALYINPEIITDQNGSATITIPIADSITTWRMALMASTPHGALGSGTSSIKVFQDFFTELDLPVTLTQGDRVSIPVAVYNYTGTNGDVNLELKNGDWFRLVEDSAEKHLNVESGRVGGSQFTLQADRIGKFKLTLAAHMAGGRSDIVVREIEVVPNGREQNTVFNGKLETSVEHAINFPGTSIPDASKVLVRLYPGPLSQVIEGMDSILRMPGGCFEQTSSSTYPNVLTLNYMKSTKKLTPEIHAKAEGFIANGYQRLLTFEVPGGGFSWFGQAPANKILTGYGLMEFSDMSKVYDVDARLIQRTQQWLASQQQPDGSWKPDTNFINEGATNRYNSDVLRITAYLGWALGNTGYQGPAVEKARQYVEKNMSGNLDAYTLAVLANFAVDYGKDREFTHRAINMLLDARTEKGEQVSWDAKETSVYSTGSSAAVETTGLAVQALLKAGESSVVAGKALAYIAANKDATGAWRTTQATIMALRALLLSTEKGASDVRGDVEISLNGTPVQHLTLTADNNDLFHQFVFPVAEAGKAANVSLRFDGKGMLAYQVVGRYFKPWTEKPAGEPLSISVAYDRTQLSQDDIATATATVKNNLNKSANMVMVDLGIPPGFDLLSEDLQDMVEKTAARKGGKLEKFSLTATQAILYFDSIAPNGSLTVKFRLRAKYPIRTRTFASRAYEYYDPEVSSTAKPVALEVRKK
jgi:A-macroglobulin TED domain/Alpha-2-macroglobulin family/MG2 domain/A-macroglobulin receptor binding domain/Carboxypeptidase regulatory-like domain/Alpha-2-macroglobulin bait region domain